MRSMLFRRKFVKYLKIILLLIVIFYEFVIYILLPFYWPAMPTCHTPSCIKILLVADPQILGKMSSNRIAIWDADKYLKKTFHLACLHVQPDIIIFLGDLMDEGNIASEEQFQSDLERFADIFALPSGMIIERIYIPGDNDIGGEDGDPIFPNIVARFSNMFEPTTEPINYLHLEFYKVNKMTQMFQEPEVISSDYTRIALSHIPILRKIHTLSVKIAKSIHPHIIFSAHDHDAAHVSAPVDDPWRKTTERISKESAPWTRCALSDTVMHEFIVPTCSYRMGTMHMGYGVGVLDQSSNSMNFAVMWLPRRLSHLFVYIFCVIFISLVAVCWFLVVCNRRLRAAGKHFLSGRIV